ncbi:hypothetical protein QQZ08_003009 [Neonectria magnoliae]|uniref:Epoxide hydrolase N-terminal domain-containing protein n=1 Tax=Neonectria magnoliae TaxID=2732573 RepID=A0ABR1IBU5_9HYPO
MASSPFAVVPPNATLDLRPFTAHVPEKDVELLKTLLRLAKLGPETYENTQNRVEFGTQRKWLGNAKDTWQHNYDWRQTENKINSFPNFIAPIEYENEVFSLHFVALFSQNPHAVPVLLLHGWPGSFLEFLDVLSIYKNKFTVADLPYHLIVPSLSGYGYSSGPPLDRSFQLKDQAQILDSLMLGLGFSGYIAQGGDVGSFLSRILGVTSNHCKAVHLNFCPMSPPESFDQTALSTAELEGLRRSEQFISRGSAYAALHMTRPATIGLALSTNPLALLSWIGEKYLEWSDEPPPLNHILDAATLYWFTESFPRSIFPYRNAGSPPNNLHGTAEYFLNIPLGYSYFPKELAPSTRNDAKDVILERIKRIEEITANIGVLKHGENATLLRNLTSSSFEAALVSAERDHHSTVSSTGTTQNNGQIYFSGLQLGTVDSRTGMPSLSSVGADWIFQATGLRPSFEYLGNGGSDVTVTTKDQSTSPRQELGTSSSQKTELPEQSMVKSLLQTFLESDLCLVYPVVDCVLFGDTLSIAYELGNEVTSTERVTAKACVFAFTCFVGVYFGDTELGRSIDVDSYAAESTKMVSEMLEDASLTMLQTMLMLVCGIHA